MANYSDSQSLLVYCFLFLVFLVCFNWRYLGKHKHVKGSSYIVLALAIIVVSLFYRPVNGDFWGYLDEYENTNLGRTLRWEDIYNYMLDISGGNYLFWRFMVWGWAAVFFCITYKIIKCPPEIAIISFVVFAIMNVYSSRDSLGVSFLTISLALYCKADNYNDLKKITPSIIFFILSFFFHKGMPVYMVMTFLGVIFPWKKKYFKFLVFFFPIAYISANYLASSFIETFITTKDYSEIGGSYLNSDKTTVVTSFGYFSLFIEYTPLFYIIHSAIKKLKDDDSEDFRVQKVFLTTTCLLLFISFLFFGQGSMFLQMRFWKKAMIYFAFFIGIYAKNNYHTREFQNFLRLMCIFYFYRVIQFIYYS